MQHKKKLQISISNKIIKSIFYVLRNMVYINNEGGVASKKKPSGNERWHPHKHYQNHNFA